MRALVWNCRGVGSPLTVPQIEESVKLHSLELIFLSETKNKKEIMNRVRLKLRYDRMVVVDPIGIAGGMAVMWRNDLKVCQILCTDFTIKVLLEKTGARDRWWLICLYASSEDLLREKQWRIIEDRMSGWGQKWVLAGDMNDILSNDEKWGRGELEA